MRRLRGEVFLSHASRDRAFVERLAGTFDSHRIPDFYSKRAIKGAQQWHDELGAALGRCEWFALVLTPKAVASIWVKRELLFALQAKRYRDRILPLLLESCTSKKLSWTLSQFQYIDFRSKRDDGIRELLSVLTAKQATPKRAP